MSSPNANRLNVLFLTLEFPKWSVAQYWSYPMGLGIEEGFRAAGVNCFTLPAFHGLSPDAPESWLTHARSLCAGKQFDLVWLPLNHLDYDPRLLEWLAGLAPQRMGLTLESLQITDEEWRDHPAACKRRREQVECTLPFITHAAVWDEGDVATLTARGIPTKWWPVNVPERFVRSGRTVPAGAAGLFFGTVYGVRAEYLKHPSLQGLLVRPEQSLEFTTDFPRQYDELNVGVTQRLAAIHARPAKGLADRLRTLIRPASQADATQTSAQPDAAADLAALEQHLVGLRRLREACFQLWLDTLAGGLAVVNLPQRGFGYGPRVVETMAAGAPAIAHRIANRPATEALYEAGREILLYDTPEELAEHLTRLRDDPAFATNLAANARAKLLESHTTEKRIQQFLQWLASAG